MYIYIIKNLINTKVYVGLTTKTIEQRWKGHLTQARIKTKHPLYNAINKYGADKFYIEMIEKCEDIKKLGERERYYIKLYNSVVPNGYNITHGGEANQLDANPRTRLTVKDVYNIREVYNQKNTSIKTCYESYKERISYSAFEKIWEGRTWSSVHMDVYTDENKQFHFQNWRVCNGEHNGNGFSDDTILEARIFYQTHTLRDTYENFGTFYVSIDSFRRAINYGYKHIPIYKKTKCAWFLNNEKIDINEYLNSKPVSTISESGE